MNHEIIIGVSVAVAIAAIFVIKTWLHRLLTFKMDESAILNFFKESNDRNKCYSNEEISAGTDLDTARVSRVCEKSKAINREPKEQASWRLS